MKIGDVRNQSFFVLKKWEERETIWLEIPRTACSFQILLFSARQGIQGLPILNLLLSPPDPTDYSLFEYDWHPERRANETH